MRSGGLVGGSPRAICASPRCRFQSRITQTSAPLRCGQIADPRLHPRSPRRILAPPRTASRPVGQRPAFRIESSLRRALRTSRFGRQPAQGARRKRSAIRYDHHQRFARRGAQPRAWHRQAEMPAASPGRVRCRSAAEALGRYRFPPSGRAPSTVETEGRPLQLGFAAGDSPEGLDIALERALNDALG